MTSNPWKKRFSLTLLFASALLIVLLASQHRVRLIAISTKLIDSSVDFKLMPSLRFLPNASYSEAPSFSDDVALLRAFDKSHPLLDGDALPTIDQPDTCLHQLEEGHRLHCYNVDIAAALMLANIHTPVRLWDLNGSTELGGDGHNLLGVYDGVSHSWKALDPYYHCYFSRIGDTVPIGVAELRTILLTSSQSLHVVRYSDTTGERPSDEIISELKFLAPGAMLHENNDFEWRYAHRYGWFTSVAAPLFDALPLRTARGVRTFMLGSQDRLLVIDDRFSPHFPFLLMKVLFYGGLILFIISAFGLIVTVPRSRRRLQ